jgi:ubiquinone/menaquinone biosynthesis C-methylase UbiE
MTQPTSKIQSDFDRIALLSDDGWDHNSHYHTYLLKQIPAHCANTLEVGCGTGVFSRLLAQRSDRVLALDLSPEMIRIARDRSSRYANISFEVADFLTQELPEKQFDCVASIATLHHLPADTALRQMKRTLKVGGTLVVLDLFRADTLPELFMGASAFAVNVVMKLVRTGRLREPAELRDAWAAHGRSDSYLTLSRVREICADILPNAEVRKYLFWRYSVVWRRTADLPTLPCRGAVTGEEGC